MLLVALVCLFVCKQHYSKSYKRITNLFAFAYRLFHEDFSPIYGAIILNHLPSLYTLT